MNLKLNRSHRTMVAGALLVTFLVVAAFQAPGAIAGPEPLAVEGADACRSTAAGLVVHGSPYTVDETVTRLVAEIDARPLNILAVVDHAANAATVPLDLRPTQLIIFGNPAVGTPIMQANQTAGIDLPQKFIVWEDACGDVYVGYNDPFYIGRRHGIRGQADRFMTITNVLEGIVAGATADES